MVKPKKKKFTGPKTITMVSFSLMIAVFSALFVIVAPVQAKIVHGHLSKTFTLEDIKEMEKVDKLLKVSLTLEQAPQSFISFDLLTGKLLDIIIRFFSIGHENSNAREILILASQLDGQKNQRNKELITLIFDKLLILLSIAYGMVKFEPKALYKISKERILKFRAGFKMIVDAVQKAGKKVGELVSKKTRKSHFDELFDKIVIYNIPIDDDEYIGYSYQQDLRNMIKANLLMTPELSLLFFGILGLYAQEREDRSKYRIRRIGQLVWIMEEKAFYDDFVVFLKKQFKWLVYHPQGIILLTLLLWNRRYIYDFICNPKDREKMLNVLFQIITYLKQMVGIEIEHDSLPPFQSMVRKMAENMAAKKLAEKALADKSAQNAVDIVSRPAENCLLSTKDNFSYGRDKTLVPFRYNYYKDGIYKTDISLALMKIHLESLARDPSIYWPGFLGTDSTNSNDDPT